MLAFRSLVTKNFGLLGCMIFSKYDVHVLKSEVFKREYTYPWRYKKFPGGSDNFPGPQLVSIILSKLIRG